MRQTFSGYIVLWKKQSAESISSMGPFKQEGRIREYTCICSFVQKTYRKDQTETEETGYIQEWVEKG